MNGTIVNGLAIALGGFIGLFLQKSLFKNISDKLFSAIGLIIVVLGLQGVIGYGREVPTDMLILIVSIAIGTFLGELWDLDGKINRFGLMIERRYAKGSNGKFAQGLVSATLLFAVGAMAIIGSLESGLLHKEITLYTKSLLDFISSIVFASTFGVGVIFAAIPVVLYQGSITLLSGFIQPLLNTIPELVGDLGAVGSLCIMALGFNMIGAAKFKVANLLPSLLVVIVLRVLIHFVFPV